jgi:glycine oxidase
VSLSIGIAGAGLLGRLLAWRLSRQGHAVSVYDPAPGPAPTFDGCQSAGFTAAGMLSPLAELDTGSPQVAALGWRSIALWRAIVDQLQARPAFAERGSLLLAHRGDAGGAQRVLARLTQAAPGTPTPQALSAETLARLEPALQGPAHAWLLPGEGHIDTVATMQALQAEAEGVRWHWQRTVADVQAGTLRFDTAPPESFDVVFDVRGVGARPTMPVRGVRGEIICLDARRHGLTRPVRLLHPRHRVYLVPRDVDTVLVGASEIESEDRSPVSLKSAVELMSAAHSVMPALAESRIKRLDVNLRPALPDHEPRTDSAPGVVRINGLFRHGWLLAPALVDDALRQAELLRPALEAAT